MSAIEILEKMRREQEAAAAGAFEGQGEPPIEEPPSDPSMRRIPQPGQVQGPLPAPPDVRGFKDQASRVLLGEDREGKQARVEAGLSMLGGTAASLIAPALGVPAAATRLLAMGASAGGAALSTAVTDRDPATAAALGAVGEGVGQLGFAAARRPLGALARFMGRTPGLRRLVGPSLNAEPGAAAAETQLLSRGGTLTAGQSTDAYLTDFFENIADSSLLGGPLIKSTRRRAEGIAVDDIYDEAARFVAIPNRAVRGQMIQETLDGVTDAFGARMRVGYQALDNDLIAAGQQTDRVVDIRPLLLEAQELLGKTQLPSRSANSMGLLQDILMDPAARVARAQGQRVAPRPRQEFVSFGEAQELRSELLALTATADDPMVSKTVGMTKSLRNTLDQAIDDAGNRLPPGFIDRYRSLNGEWKAGHETYNNDFIKQVVKLEDPELLFDTAVKDGMPTRITKLREALQDSPEYPRVWNEIQGQWIDGLLQKSRSRIPGSIEERLDGDALLRHLDSFGEAEGALFPGTGLTHLRQLAHTLALTQKSAGPNRGGAMFIQLAQAGAFLQVAGNVAGNLGAGNGTQNAVDAASWGIMLGPPALALAFRDPRFVRYLTIGLQEPVGSKTALRAAGQLLTRAAELGIADQGAILPDPNPVKTVVNNIGDVMEDRVLSKVRDAGNAVRAGVQEAGREAFPPFQATPADPVDKFKEQVRRRSGGF